MTSSVDGLISGLSTSDMITQLMAVERAPQTRLTTTRKTNESLISVYQTLNTRMLAIKDASTAISNATDWSVTKASSSDTTIASASATNAAPGTMTFRVEQLAAAQTLVSAGSVSSTTASIVPADTRWLVSSAAKLGFSNLSGSATLSDGSHTVTVTQSSAGAVQESAPLGTTITILPDTTVEVATDGTTNTTQTLTLTGGTYTRQQLLDEINTKSGATFNATITAEGRLRLETVREGSAAKLAVTGGTALSALGFTASATASSGTDAIMTVDGTSTTISDLSAGTNATLDAGSGASITATLTGGLRAGTAIAVNVNLGDGKLSTVASAINAAGAGVRATMVQVSPGNYRLQLAASSTGTTGRITADTSLLDTAFGGMTTLTAAKDAILRIGSGTSSYTVTSPTNAVELLPGVTVTALKEAPTTDLTVTVDSDADALATKVSSLVDAVNGALSYVKSQSTYNAVTKTGGPLLGDSTARALQSRLYDMLSTTGTDLSALGIKLDSNAAFTFDKTKFVAAYNAAPTATQAKFTDAATGIAARLKDLGEDATKSVTGTLTTAISGKQALTKSLDSRISAWDTRLALREKALKRTYANLEVMLGNLKNQSSWLSSQIANLPTYSS